MTSSNQANQQGKSISLQKDWLEKITTCQQALEVYIPNLGSGAYLLSTLIEQKSEQQDYLLIVPDDMRMRSYRELITKFAPQVELLEFPAWDCVPYDRVGPKKELTAQRIATLVKLVRGKRKGPRFVITTARAITQKIPSPDFIRSVVKILAPGKQIDRNRLIKLLTKSGFERTDMVQAVGDFAVRGGLIDLYPAGYKHPVRLDFFGQDLDAIRAFDAQSQRSKKTLQRCVLMPVKEFAFDEKARGRFREQYLSHFGVPSKDDGLYQTLSEGFYYQGAEHWLPFFHENLASLFDFLPKSDLLVDFQTDLALGNVFEQIEDHYKSRTEFLEEASFGAGIYNPVPMDEMYLTPAILQEKLSKAAIQFNEFLSHEVESGPSNFLNPGFKKARRFTLERENKDIDLIESLRDYLNSSLGERKKIIIACRTEGSRARLMDLLKEANFTNIQAKQTIKEALESSSHTIFMVCLPLHEGYEIDELQIISEEDIFGPLKSHARARRKKGAEVLKDAGGLSVGDHVVHVDHGIGRFEGLRTLTAAGADHDCLELTYADGGRLFLPVENIELLSRYGSDDVLVKLDRLGGASWQARKARVKERIKEIAEDLMKVAASRVLQTAPKFKVDSDAYQGFVARFPYAETEDQLDAIDDVLEDLSCGKPMDRLICGDVGFGKTEVALRATFVTALSGKQVALIAPTTLLARQHFHTFKERFKGTPIHVAHASRLVSAKDLKANKEGIKEGTIDVIIGTHALLGDKIDFANLGLVIVDEEQRFGVKHKEKLKNLKRNVHVLTLSATPIPRTLQMALTGVRDLSLITTPPVDRLAVRTFVSPFDEMIIKEALSREKIRGGQSFFVCPRIDDLPEAEEFLREKLPGLTFATAHGQMPAKNLEAVMNDFYDRKFHVLLSTTIVESGLDIENANTLIVYRADMFGLAQLYQLRGRVGRSKTRGYAYLTTRPGKKLSDAGQKRLKVMNSLEGLGAGFNLASYDLDMRGGGNLVGEEQSGHIKEVGFELYQSMLEEAIAALKDDEGASASDAHWSPTIALGVSVLIPETYVSDLDLRLDLYRRLAHLKEREDIQNFAVELHDRFGAPPEETRHLFNVAEIKILCRGAFVQSVEAGPLGAQFTFRPNAPLPIEKLLVFAESQKKNIKLMPDDKIIVKGAWENIEERVRGVKQTLRDLMKLFDKDGA